MTVKARGGQLYLDWQVSDEPDWATPNVTDGDHEYCGNCGLDYPGCGCPRDCPRCWELRGYCGHLSPQPVRGTTLASLTIDNSQPPLDR